VVLEPQRCGNGRPDPGEQCDPGNADDSVCCDSQCRLTFDPAVGRACRAAVGTCDVTDFCRAMPSSSTPGFFDVSCPDTVGSAGDACFEGGPECDVIGTCDGTTTQCRPVGGGTPCGLEGPCVEQLVSCDGGTCPSQTFKPDQTACVEPLACISGTCSQGTCTGSYAPENCGPSSFEDITPCEANDFVNDHWRFDVTAGSRIALALDTVDADSAADLVTFVDCNNGSFGAGGDDEMACAFAPDGFGCPRLSFTAVENGTCDVFLSAFPGSCHDPATARYRLAVTRDGAPAELTLVDDDFFFGGETTGQERRSRRQWDAHKHAAKGDVR
jgi:hypothetical protein